MGKLLLPAFNRQKKSASVVCLLHIRQFARHFGYSRAAETMDVATREASVCPLLHHLLVM